MQLVKPFSDPTENENGNDGQLFSSIRFGLKPKDPFSLTSSQRTFYITSFISLDADQDGFITNEEALDFIKKTKLSMDSLNKVVQLCDIDQDGYLDLSEFICAAHISYVCRDGRPLPEEIPDCLMDPQKKEYLEKEKEEKKVENPFGDAFAMELVFQMMLSPKLRASRIPF